MLIRDIINESPLPDDWDVSSFDDAKQHDERVMYAVQRALKLGKGSSRTVVSIDYQGRATALKVAHNDAGIAQNAAELAVLADPTVRSLGITIPVIDCHDNESQPTWIQMEKGEPASEDALCSIMRCGDLVILVCLAENLMGKKSALSIKEIYDLLVNSYGYSIDDIDVAESYANKIVSLYQNHKLVLRDLTMPSNWALYQGEPVIIDAGFNTDVQQMHYA